MNAVYMGVCCDGVAGSVTLAIIIAALEIYEEYFKHRQWRTTWNFQTKSILSYMQTHRGATGRKEPRVKNRGMQRSITTP